MINRAYLPALIALLTYYEGDENAEFKGRLVATHCPLCQVSEDLRKTLNNDQFSVLIKKAVEERLPLDCMPCPWITELNQHCTDFARRNFIQVDGTVGCGSPGVLKLAFNGPWVETRKEQILDWIKV